MKIFFVLIEFFSSYLYISESKSLAKKGKILSWCISGSVIYIEGMISCNYIMDVIIWFSYIG